MEELYYLAGLIDGEGTITLSKNHKTSKFRTPIISMSSTTYELVEYLKQNYGGSISKHKVYQDHHKQSWSWKLDYMNAVKLCNKIKNLLREPSKKYRAQFISQYYPLVTKRNGKYTDKEIETKLFFEDSFFHPSTPFQESMSL
jgi:hypothetical protein